MKMPEYIKKAVRDSAKHYAIATENNLKIRKWLYKNDLANDGNIDTLIDSIELNNNPEFFINQIENDPFEGNDEEYNFD